MMAGCVAGLGVILGAWIGFGLGVGLGTQIFNPVKLVEFYSLSVSKGRWQAMGPLVCHSFYAIEALAMLLPAFLFSGRIVGPFCESCQEFPETQTPLRVGYCVDEGMAKQCIMGVSQSLKNYFTAPNADHYGNFVFSVCKKCTNYYVLKLDNVTKTKNEKGRDVEQKNIIVQDIVMDRKHSSMLKKIIVSRK